MNYIRAQWGYECYFNNYNSQSRGMAILINNNFDFKFNNCDTDQNGNLFVLQASITNIDITMFYIYGPNKDDPDFYLTLKDKILQSQNPCIVVDDYNLLLDPSMDCFNYLNVYNRKAREVVLEMILQCSLVDCWRELNLEGKQYTWFKKNPIKKQDKTFS